VCDELDYIMEELITIFEEGHGGQVNSVQRQLPGTLKCGGMFICIPPKEGEFWSDMERIGRERCVC